VLAGLRCATLSSVPSCCSTVVGMRSSASCSCCDRKRSCCRLLLMVLLVGSGSAAAALRAIATAEGSCTAPRATNDGNTDRHASWSAPSARHHCQ
jgi:hypothetical protein